MSSLKSLPDTILQGSYIHEVEDRWALALASTTFVVDVFHDEIKRAARQLVRAGKGAFMFDFQDTELTTYWRDDELEEALIIHAPPINQTQKAKKPPLEIGVLYDGHSVPRPQHDPKTCTGDLCAEMRTWV